MPVITGDIPLYIREKPTINGIYRAWEASTGCGAD
jgi:hypothetical protein